MRPSSQEYGEECSKLANQRYGLTRGMQALMRGLNCDNETKNKIVDLAKNRKFQEMEDLIDKSI